MTSSNGDVAFEVSGGLVSTYTYEGPGGTRIVSRLAVGPPAGEQTIATVAPGHTVGRVAVATDASGRATAVWVDADPGGSRQLYTASRTDDDVSGWVGPPKNAP